MFQSRHNFQFSYQKTRYFELIETLLLETKVDYNESSTVENKLGFANFVNVLNIDRKSGGVNLFWKNGYMSHVCLKGFSLFLKLGT